MLGHVPRLLRYSSRHRPRTYHGSLDLCSNIILLQIFRLLRRNGARFQIASACGHTAAQGDSQGFAAGQDHPARPKTLASWDATEVDPY